MRLHNTPMTKPFKSSLLNKPWPFGLAGPSTAIYVALLGAALALLYLIDHPLPVYTSLCGGVWVPFWPTHWFWHKA